MKSHTCLMTIAAAILLASETAAALVVDGTADPDYGIPLVVQTTQTSSFDNNDSRLDGSSGSELDQGYALIANGTLYLLIAGNLHTDWGGISPSSYSDNLEILFDTKPGGQNQLRDDNPNVGDELSQMAGLTFDTDFSPDYWVEFHGNAYPLAPYYLTVNYAELLTSDGGTGYMVGNGTAGGTGTLASGTNPFGILASIDNHNVAGVAHGCGPASGAGVTTGVEFAIPLAALGNPTGCIKVSAFAVAYSVINQVLSSVPSGTCDLGVPSTVNFASIPDNQYFAVCSTITPIRTTTWGRLKTIYR